MKTHPELHIQELRIGNEAAPMAVIDNAVGNPDELVALAASKVFASDNTFYPGIRAKTPLSYNQYILSTFGGLMANLFGLGNHTPRMTQCHFSIVTTPADKLVYLQTIPHTDTYNSNELAFVHYLFRRDYGGTAFYRHRGTGFETVDLTRVEQYSAAIGAEARRCERGPRGGYMKASNVFYERIGAQRGVYNRLVLYRRNSLHSGDLAPDFVPDPNPLTGRLTITGFIA